MFAGAATATTDALPSLCWRMLCRLCFTRLADTFAALATPTLTDALPSWLLLVGRPRWMLCRRGDVLVDAWPPSCCYRVSVSDLVMVLYV